MKIHLNHLIKELSDEFNFALAAPADLIQEMGVRGHAIEIPDRLSPFQLPFLVLQLIRIIRKEQPSIIHAHGYVAGTIAAMAGSLAGARSILCTLHNLFPPSASPVGKRALQICGRSCTHLIAITQAVKDSATVVGVDPSKIVIIPNGIELSIYQQPHDKALIRQKLGIDPAAPVVLTASRLIPAKGIDTLLRAATGLRQIFPSIQVLIAGDGPQREELKTLAKELELDETVQFLGERKDIPELLAASDVVAVPSLAEGQSILILEGMASRLPVVASDIGGMKEMIQDGETGLLVPAANPTALAQALGLVLNDAKLAEKLGTQGQRFVEANMTLEQMLEKTRRLYRDEIEKATA
jgi:glycosyltransferase involved in cell wall biosynthesis